MNLVTKKCYWYKIWLLLLPFMISPSNDIMILNNIAKYKNLNFVSKHNTYHKKNQVIILDTK